MTTYLQTGDILYFKIESLPKNVDELKTDLFHKGENHSHRVRGDFSIYKSGDDMYLECRGVCELFHEEHTVIKADPGIYKKRVVLEYDHILEESREVID